MQVALFDFTALVAAIPSEWKDKARAVLQARRPLGLPVVTADLLTAARARVCADLGWETRDGDVVRPKDLTVALGTKLQCLELSPRHC